MSNNFRVKLILSFRRRRNLKADVPQIPPSSEGQNVDFILLKTQLLNNPKLNLNAVVRA